jgi:hypothetical protein
MPAEFLAVSVLLGVAASILAIRRYLLEQYPSSDWVRWTKRLVPTTCVLLSLGWFLLAAWVVLLFGLGAVVQQVTNLIVLSGCACFLWRTIRSETGGRDGA